MQSLFLLLLLFITAIPSIIAIIIYLGVWRNFLHSRSKKIITTWRIFNLEAKDENMTFKEILKDNKHRFSSFLALFFFLLFPSYILFGGVRIILFGFDRAGFSVIYYPVVVFIVYIYHYRILK